MDSMYNLFFVIAMIALYEMTKDPCFMFVYGASLGLAFMCKGPHAALIFVIGLLYIPKIKNAFASIMRVVASAILAVIIPVVWIVKRYLFDGTKLFEALFGREVTGRLSDADHGAELPWVDLVTSQIFTIFMVVIVLFIIVVVISARDFRRVFRMIIEFAGDNYLFAIWVVVPVIFFSITRSYLTWYTYTSFIALSILTARVVDYCVRCARRNESISKIRVNCGKALGAIIPIVVIMLAFISIIPTITKIKSDGTGGLPVDQFTYDIEGFKEKYGDTYAGVNAYLIADFLIGTGNVDHWEPEYVAPAEMYLDLMPVDGMLGDFLHDPDAILILDKKRWDDYAEVLTGHVILYDNEYMFFTNDMY